MLLLKVLASFVALTVVLAAPVPTAPLRERSIGLLEDAYLPMKRAEGCECEHSHSLKSVDAPRDREAHKKIKHHKVDIDETLRPSEETEIEKRTWGPVKTVLRAVGLMRPSPGAAGAPAAAPAAPAAAAGANTNQGRQNSYSSGFTMGSTNSHQAPARKSSSIGGH